MTKNDIEKNMEIAYKQVFYTMLMKEISECNKIDFNNLSEKNRNEIGRKTSDKSAVLAKGFISELKKNGFLERRPTDEDLRSLFTQYVKKVNQEQ